MSSQPKVTPRRSSSKKGSDVSQTYEFPYMRQARQRTLGQLIYDGRQGKILGRTPKNWGKRRWMMASSRVLFALRISIIRKSHVNIYTSPRYLEMWSWLSRMPSTVDSINYEVSGWAWLNMLSIVQSINTEVESSAARWFIASYQPLSLKSRPNCSSDLSNCVIKTFFIHLPRMTMSSRLRNFFSSLFIAADNKVKHCCCCFGDNIIDNDNRGRETVIIYASCGWAITKPFAVAIACGRTTYSIE